MNVIILVRTRAKGNVLIHVKILVPVVQELVKILVRENAQVAKVVVREGAIRHVSTDVVLVPDRVLALAIGHA